MNISNRDRNNCKNCIYYNYLQCAFVRIDGTCSLTGYKVAFTDNTIHK